MSGTDQLAVWSEQADRAAHQGRWVDAAGLLENIHSVDPGYPDLPRRLTVAVARRQEQAEGRRQQLSALHVRAGQAEAGGRVDEAVSALAQLVALDPANADAARRLQALRQQGGSGFDPVAWAGPPAAYAATPPGQPGPYGQPTPSGPPPDLADAGGSSAAAGRPARDGGRSRTWIIAALAAALVLALVVSTVLLRDRIASVVGGPSSTPTVLPSATATSTPTPSPTPTAGLTSTRLRNHIPRAVGASCDDYAPPVGDALEVNLTGALRCQLSDASAPDTVWYLAYSDAEAMGVASRPFADATFTNGDCRAKDERFVYTDTEPGEEASGGLLLCYESEAGETSFVWTHDDLRVLSFAVDPDLSFPDMKSWWEGAGPVR